MPATLTAMLLGLAVEPARALTIHPTFDSSITGLSNSAQWESAIAYADGQYDSLFSDPITINILFKANPGKSIFGQSAAGGVTIGNYATVKTLLAAHATSADDHSAVANLPIADPTNGGTFIALDGQAKALGLLPANGAENDGTVTIGEGFNFTMDPNNRAVPGNYDFFGIAEHEISEVMGRYGDADLGSHYGILDLFGYQFTGGTGSGVLNLAQNQTNNYFSIDGGVTPLKLYNDHANGEDDKDWGTGSNDAYNAFSSSGVENNISAVDIREMDVIGYTVAPVPEPVATGLLAVGVAGLLPRRRRSRPG